MKAGSYHLNHVHPCSARSSCLYCQTTRGRHGCPQRQGQGNWSECLFPLSTPLFLFGQVFILNCLLHLSLLRSKLSQCPLRVCPELDDYQKHCGPLRLGLAGQHQHSNASLAIQLSHSWLQRRRLPGGAFKLLLLIQTATINLAVCLCLTASSRTSNRSERSLQA